MKKIIIFYSWNILDTNYIPYRYYYIDNSSL